LAPAEGMAGMAGRGATMVESLKAKWTMLVALALLIGSDGRPSGIVARHPEGPTRGFLVLRSADGKVAAVGDLVQTVRADHVVSHLVFRFKDGSLRDQTTEFTQHGSFRLLKDHLVQKGPSFKLQLEALLDAPGGQYTVRYQDKDGRQRELTQHVDVPTDLANGLLWIMAKNIDDDTPETSVSMIAASPKPRLVKLRLIQRGREVFSLAGSPRKAIHFTVKVELPGVAGWLARLLGKRIPATELWVLGGDVPLFLKSEGPFDEDGPIWTVELASPEGPQEAKPPAKP